MSPEAGSATIRNAVLSDAMDDLADAHFAIGYASGWVTNADTKAGLLSAAIALILGASGQQISKIHLIMALRNGAAWTALALLVAMGICVVTAIGALASVLIPRTTPPRRPSRFGYPTLSSPAWKHTPASRVEAAEEAWDQAGVISGIASTKFRALRVASKAVFLALPFYGAWIVAASFVV